MLEIILWYLLSFNCLSLCVDQESQMCHYHSSGTIWYSIRDWMICSFWSIFLPIVFWHEVIIFRVLLSQIIVNRLKVYDSVYVCKWLVIMKLLFLIIHCFPCKKFQGTKFAHVWCQGTGAPVHRTVTNWEWRKQMLF